MKIILKSVMSILVVAVILQTESGSPAWSNQSEPIIEMLSVKNMTFRQFAVLLSRDTGYKVVVSSNAGDIPVHLYLEHVGVEEALAAACRAYQCWYKRDPHTDIITVITLEEYKQGLSLHEEDIVKTFKLCHVDARTVGDSLHRLFRDRVIWERPDDEEDDGIEDLEQVLERMDTLADRTQFSQGSQHSGSGSGRTRSSYDRGGRYDRGRHYDRGGRYDRGGSYNRGGRYGGGSAPDLMKDVEIDVTPEALLGQLIGERMNEDGDVLRPGVVFISVLSSTNTLLVRTADSATMTSIIEVIDKLDKPKPQVLLEVKVLEIKLDDERRQGVDWLFQNADISGGHAPGFPGDTLGDGFSQMLPPDMNLVPQGTGLDPQAALFQVVSKKVAARIQLLEEQGVITSLATPTLCVADNEASRIFIGTQKSILTGVNVSTYIYGDDRPLPETFIDPETERRDVGTTLLITPKIHSDTSVTLRIVHEDSLLGDITEINYGTDQSFKSQDVKTRSIVSTIVTRDGEISAVGGLIREQTQRVDSGIPFLKDIPYLGVLFKAQRESKLRSELFVLLRPYILRGPGETDQLTSDFIKRLSVHPSARDDIPALGVYDKDDTAVADTPALNELKESAQPQETE